MYLLQLLAGCRSSRAFNSVRRPDNAQGCFEAGQIGWTFPMLTFALEVLCCCSQASHCCWPSSKTLADLEFSMSLYSCLDFEFQAIRFLDDLDQS